MKKFVKVFLIALCALMFSGAFGQGGFAPVYVIPNLTTTFKTTVPAGSLVYVQSTDRFYNILVGCGRTVDMTWVLADGSRYDDATIAALGSTVTVTDSIISPVIDATNRYILGSQILTQNTINNILANNSFTATDTLFAPVIDATTKMLVKSQTITQDNVNKATFNNSLKVTDSLFIGSGQALWQNNINGIKANNSITATDTVFAPFHKADLYYFIGNQTINAPNVNNIGFQNSVTVADTLFLGSGQYLFQNNINGIKANNSITATDTVFAPMLSASMYVFVNGQTINAPTINRTGVNHSFSAVDTIFAPVIDATTKVLVASQEISQDNTNRLDVNNSLQVNDTLYLGTNQYLFQNNLNGVKGEGSITVTDTLYAPYISNTTQYTLGSQVMTQKNTNGVTYNNSITATDTVFATVVSSVGDISGTGITGAELPTFTIAAGTATPVLLADTVNVAVSGLTTGAIIICSYAAYVAPTDTTCYVKTVKTGHFTLCGKNGVPINYWIPKK